MTKNKNIKVFFTLGNRHFVIEFTEFTINTLSCAHVEFGQKIGPFTAQFTMHNMDKHKAIAVLRKVIEETQHHYSHFDMVVFTSLDGNEKRDAIYGRITRDMAKRNHCELSISDINATHGKLFVLHRGCYNELIDEELQETLSKNGLLIIGGGILLAFYSTLDFFGGILDFLPF
jgi:hypothetical protein